MIQVGGQLKRPDWSGLKLKKRISNGGKQRVKPPTVYTTTIWSMAECRAKVYHNEVGGLCLIIIPNWEEKNGNSIFLTLNEVKFHSSLNYDDIGFPIPHPDDVASPYLMAVIDNINFHKSAYYEGTLEPLLHKFVETVPNRVSEVRITQALHGVRIVGVDRIPKKIIEAYGCQGCINVKDHQGKMDWRQYNAYLMDSTPGSDDSIHLRAYYDHEISFERTRELDDEAAEAYFPEQELQALADWQRLERMRNKEMVPKYVGPPVNDQPTSLWRSETRPGCMSPILKNAAGVSTNTSSETSILASRTQELMASTPSTRKEQCETVAKATTSVIPESDGKDSGVSKAQAQAQTAEKTAAEMTAVDDDDEEVPELLEPEHPGLSTGIQSKISAAIVMTRGARLRPLHNVFIKKEEKETPSSSPIKKKSCRPPMRLASSDEEAEQAPKPKDDPKDPGSNPRKRKRLTSEVAQI